MIRKFWLKILNKLRPVRFALPSPQDDGYSFVEPEIRALWAQGAREHLQGFVSRAVIHWSRAMDLQHLLANREGLKQDFRYFGPVWIGVIGHIGHLTSLLQARQLGLFKARKIIIDARFGSANPAYLEYLGKHCEIIRDQAQFDQFDIRFKSELPAVVRLGGKWLFLIDAVRIILDQWEAERRGPLLRLTDGHRLRGEAALREWGVPAGAWFVTLHVREGGRISGGWETDSIRNCSVADYIEAIRFITSRGGWVVRIGGSDYEPLPPMDGVIDYATGKPHEDWIDVYLLAAARFMIATNSGPPWVAVSFGVPVLFTNWAPRGINLFWSGCTVLHKTLIDADSGEDLPIEIQTMEPASQIESLKTLREMGYKVRTNSSAEIAQATAEFLAKLPETGSSAINLDPLSPL